MPRPKKPLPTYRHHKARNLVTVAGRDVYLGKYGSPESLAKYERVCAEIRIPTRRLRQHVADAGAAGRALVAWGMDRELR
jgi:hypothetical protein